MEGTDSAKGGAGAKPADKPGDKDAGGKTDQMQTGRPGDRPVTTAASDMDKVTDKPRDEKPKDEKAKTKADVVTLTDADRLWIRNEIELALLGHSQPSRADLNP